MYKYSYASFCTNEINSNRSSTILYHLTIIFFCFSLLFSAFGMYDTAVARYKALLATSQKWSSNKSYDQNMTDLNDGNPMRSFDDSAINLAKLLEHHYDPQLAETRIRQVHDMLGGGKDKQLLTEAERNEIGWEAAYDLRPWHEFPDTERVTPQSVVLQNLTGSWLCCGGGPTKASQDLGVHIRRVIAQSLQ
jgi:hypothetical protein